MPTYIYKCSKCGRMKEIVCKIADRPESFPCDDIFWDDDIGVPCNGRWTQVITAPTLKLSDTVNIPWIRRAMNYLEPEQAQQYDTREKYQAYLDSRNLRPVDGTNLSEV